MKKIIALILLVGSLQNSNAQVSEGVVKYILTQSWIKKLKPLTFISKQSKEKMEYQWGSRSEWKTAHILYFNASESRFIDSEEKVDKDADETYSWRKETYSIYRNFEKNSINDAIEMLGKTYLVEDSTYIVDWKVGNDIKDIAGHICMNAFTEDSVKLQKITAWFALDIPLKAGPERFHGLPGLILELDINNGAAVYTAQSIDFKKLTNELELPKKLKGKKMNNTAFRSVIEKHMAEKIKAEEFPYWGIRY